MLQVKLFMTAIERAALDIAVPQNVILGTHGKKIEYPHMALTFLNCATSTIEPKTSTKATACGNSS